MIRGLLQGFLRFLQPPPLVFTTPSFCCAQQAPAGVQSRVCCHKQPELPNDIHEAAAEEPAVLQQPSSLGQTVKQARKAHASTRQVNEGTSAL